MTQWEFCLSWDVEGKTQFWLTLEVTVWAVPHTKGSTGDPEDLRENLVRPRSELRGPASQQAPQPSQASWASRARPLGATKPQCLPDEHWHLTFWDSERSLPWSQVLKVLLSFCFKRDGRVLPQRHSRAVPLPNRPSETDPPSSSWHEPGHRTSPELCPHFGLVSLQNWKKSLLLISPLGYSTWLEKPKRTLRYTLYSFSTGCSCFFF